MSRAVTQSCVATVHMLKTAGCGLSEIAFTLGRSEAEIDRVSWALVGRSIPDATKAINAPRVIAGGAA